MTAEQGKFSQLCPLLGRSQLSVASERVDCSPSYRVGERKSPPCARLFFSRAGVLAHSTNPVKAHRPRVVLVKQHSDNARVKIMFNDFLCSSNMY